MRNRGEGNMEFVTKENVHEASDVSRIRRLMASASASPGWGYAGRDGDNVWFLGIKGKE